MKAYRRHTRGLSWDVIGLSQTCETVSIRDGWSVAEMRDSFHGVSTVCRSSVRWGSWVVVSLS